MVIEQKAPKARKLPSAAVDLDVVISVDAADMDANPYQPDTRKDVADDVAEKYGRSILHAGMIQMPVVRQVGDRYQVGDGWLRRAGILWLAANGHRKDTLIPVMIRQLTDQQMADMVMEANTVRQDLDPIELANLFRRYLEDFGITQAALAKTHNCSQGEIANSIRLLELPEEIQAVIISREITVAHARQLLRLARWPADQEELLGRALRQNWSATMLEREISSWRWHHSKAIEVVAGGWEQMPAFNRKACADCEWREVFGNPYHSDVKKGARCLNPECYDEKQAAAITSAAGRRNAKLTKAVAGEAGGESDGELHVFAYRQLKSEDYEEIFDHTGKRRIPVDRPEECKTCPKRARHDRYGDEKLVEICLDPKCHRRKMTAWTRADNKRKKGVDTDLTARIGLIVDSAYSHELDVIQEAASRLFYNVPSAGLGDVARQIDGMPTYDNGHIDRSKIGAHIRGLNKRAVLKLLAASTFAISRRGTWTADGFSTTIPVDTRHLAAVLEGKVADLQAEIWDWQEKHCRGCSWADKDKIGKDVDNLSAACGCGHHTSRSILEDGSCRDRVKAKDAKAVAAAAPARGV